MKAHRALEWAEAKKRCRLSDEALRMAKELGVGPRALIKNIPAKSQQWKLPVEAWVRALHRKRFGEPRPRVSAARADESRLAPRQESLPDFRATYCRKLKTRCGKSSKATRSMPSISRLSWIRCGRASPFPRARSKRRIGCRSRSLDQRLHRSALAQAGCRPGARRMARRASEFARGGAPPSGHVPARSVDRPVSRQLVPLRRMPEGKAGVCSARLRCFAVRADPGSSEL